MALLTRWITQLVCGIVSEGIDPHASSLIYQLRIISRDEIAPRDAPSPSERGWAADSPIDSPRNPLPSRPPHARQGHPPLPTTQAQGGATSQRQGGGGGGGGGGTVSRLVPERVQISTSTLGKVRPPCRAEAGPNPKPTPKPLP